MAPTTVPWQASTIERRAVITLRRNPRNARLHPPEQVEQLVAAYREFGITNPLLVDEADEVIAGHGRLDAAEALGLVEVPVIVRPGLSAAQKRALALADNKIALNGAWDEAMLAAELAALVEDGGVDPFSAGFGDEEVDAILATVADQGDAEGDEPAARLREVSAEARFWLSVQGPLRAQPEALKAIKALAALPGVEVASNVHE